ncbi:MAG: hypothetical protein HDS70_00405 [Bacteroidales bacterium]|nr:hypothetical protein [Bacteroidales bacterium]MBD5217918.1 hypothetical protein [Bacteroidales bacterium]MBD5220820.1 hypothetical protein [Bacteroidales bacterium]
MGKRIKYSLFWLRRRSHLPVFIVGGVIILVLFLNEDTSIALNVEYQKEINRLTAEIESCRDSAIYYREKREAILNGKEDLERIAREQYNMQKATEDIFIIND